MTAPVTTRPVTGQPRSASLRQPDYWWYRARARLLRVALADFVGTPTRVLDVGSADGPSVGWLRGDHQHVTLDVSAQGLVPGEGVCGSVLALPFRDGTFEVVGAFDVLEHCEPEAQAMRELARVLTPGGRLLLSVPAYQWAWTDHDVQAGHHRRYTRGRVLRAVRDTGLVPHRVTYAFTIVFPFFVAERVLRRVAQSLGAQTRRRLTPVPPFLERLLMLLSGVDARLLAGRDLPFGSSVLVAAVKA